MIRRYEVWGLELWGREGLLCCISISRFTSTCIASANHSRRCSLHTDLHLFWNLREAGRKSWCMKARRTVNTPISIRKAVRSIPHSASNHILHAHIVSTGFYWIPLSPPAPVPAPSPPVPSPSKALGAPAIIAILLWPAWVAANLCFFLSASASFSDSISATIFSISDVSRFCY